MDKNVYEPTGGAYGTGRGESKREVDGTRDSSSMEAYMSGPMRRGFSCARAR